MVLPKDERIKILSKATIERKEESEKAALSAIESMLNTGVPITFGAVAKHAGVSTVYLHKHPKLSPKIKQLKKQLEAVYGELYKNG